MRAFSHIRLETLVHFKVAMSIGGQNFQGGFKRVLI